MHDRRSAEEHAETQEQPAGGLVQVEDWGRAMTSQAYSSTAAMLRKLRAPQRFDRVRAARPLDTRIREYWTGGIAALFDYLTETKGWDRIAQFTRLAAAAGKSLRKSLTDEERQLLVELLSKFGYYEDLDRVAQAIVDATAKATFEQAAVHALRNLGIKSADFELKNPQILERLQARVSAPIFATRNHIDQVFDTIVGNFYELGRNPFDAQFLEQLREDLGGVANYQAKRFALTETGIAAEMAQMETYRRNGVQRKRWNMLGVNTRDSHERMDGTEVGIDEQFVVLSNNGEKYFADRPLDPELPAWELINCHCWLSPVVSSDFSLDPKRIWEGK